jgi:S1-C subfamily serine protease
MKKGDIIIEINRKKVRNIYDYMARLAELKHGDEVMVKIIRDKIDIELVLNL